MRLFDGVGISEFCPRRTSWCSTKGAECKVCQDLRREREKICVVEEPADMVAVENCHEFKGLYHVLHGTISPLNGVGPDSLRIKELMERVRYSEGLGFN